MKHPNLLIIGKQKAGTESLRYNLSKHPDINILPGLFYFTVNYHYGEDWYLKKFSKIKSRIAGSSVPDITFQKNLELACQRIKRFNPNMKLILTLRNPVDRAYSAWNMYINKQITNLSFDDLIKLYQAGKLKNQMEIDIIEDGFYIDQLTILYKYFNPQQIHICFLENIQSNPVEEYQKIQKFLAIDYHKLDLKHYHKGNYNTNLSTSILQYLEELYKPYNQKLRDLIPESSY